MYVFLALSAEKVTKNDNPVALDTPGTQILISKYHSPIKGSRDSVERAQEHSNSLEGPPSGQS